MWQGGVNCIAADCKALLLCSLNTASCCKYPRKLLNKHPAQTTTKINSTRIYGNQNYIQMASALKNLSDYDESNIPDGSEMSIGIVVADWNKDITHALYEGCYDTLTKHGVAADKIKTLQVPGTFELPAGARILSGREKLDAVVCIGCVIQGETKHNEYINNSVAQGLVNLSIASGKPFVFGVLTPNDHEQAVDRAGGKYGNKGVEAAVTALRMGAIYKTGKVGSKGTIGFNV